MSVLLDGRSDSHNFPKRPGCYISNAPIGALVYLCFALEEHKCFNAAAFCWVRADLAVSKHSPFLIKSLYMWLSHLCSIVRHYYMPFSMTTFLQPYRNIFKKFSLFIFIFQPLPPRSSIFPNSSFTSPPPTPLPSPFYSPSNVLVVLMEAKLED